MRLYGVIYGLVYALAWVVSPFSRKLRRGLVARRGLFERLAGFPAGGVWMHVASAGELEQALPIMDEARRRDPNRPILLTYFSPSGERAAHLEADRRGKRGASAPWDYADYSPLDFKSCVRKFLDTVRPSAFVAIHRETWPRIIEECHRRKIPCYLFAAFFSQRSRKLWRFYRKSFSRFSLIGTTEASTNQFLQERLPSVRVEPLGDPRIDRVLARRQAHAAPPWREFFPGKTVVFASLWPKDVDALAPLLADLPARLVLVPHEPTPAFVNSLVERLKGLGIPVRLWSRWLMDPDTGSALIVDNVGLLAELYATADAVFVGGSFVGRVHNVLEPAAYGCPIVTGPFIENSVEAVDLEKRGSLIRTHDTEGLRSAFQRVLKQPEAFKITLSTYLAEKRGAGARCADSLL